MEPKWKSQVKWLKIGEKLAYFVTVMTLILIGAAVTIECCLKFFDEPTYMDTQLGKHIFNLK